MRFLSEPPQGFFDKIEIYTRGETNATEWARSLNVSKRVLHRWLHERKIKRGFGFKKKGISEPIRIPNEIDLAWAAGFIEGEGCFTNHQLKQNNVIRSRKITASQNNTEPLIKLQEIFGGTLLSKIQHASTIKPERTINYWRVSGQRAEEVVMLIYPYLSELRKSQAIKLVRKEENCALLQHIS